MEEQKLEIQENGQYNNITLKTKYEWDTSKKQFKFDSNGDKILKTQGIKPGNYIVVEKKYAEGMPKDDKFNPEKQNYACAVTYQDKEVSFWLNQYEHEAYAQCGGEGDKVKISCTQEERLNKKLGVKVPIDVLSFEKVA